MDSTTEVHQSSKSWLLHKLYAKGDSNAANQFIRNLNPNRNSGSEHTFFVQGLLLLNENKVPVALELFQQCNVRDPANPEYLNHIGVCLYRQGRYTKAIEAFQAAQKMSETLCFQNCSYLALSYAKTSDFQAAEENCRRALAICKQLETYELLAECLSQQEKYSEALEAYKLALSLYSTSSQLYTKYGLLCLKLHFNEDATKAFAAALVLDSGNVEASLALGSIHQQNEDYDDAIKVYKAALERDQSRAEIYTNLGTCFFRKNKFVAALSCLHKSLSMDPLRAETLFNIGLVHASLRQYTSAALCWKTALEIEPENTEILEALAEVLEKVNDPVNCRLVQEKLELLSET